MNITEEKPKERNFTIELTENELKLLGVIVGNTIPNDLKECCKGDSFILDVEYESDFVRVFYDKIINILK